LSAASRREETCASVNIFGGVVPAIAHESDIYRRRPVRFRPG
jgi:hypothetical protein